jgi:hypothetical protein
VTSLPKPFNFAKVFEPKPSEGGAQDGSGAQDGRRNCDEQRHWPTQQPDDRTAEGNHRQHPRETTHTSDRIPPFHPTRLSSARQALVNFGAGAITGFIDRWSQSRRLADCEADGHDFLEFVSGRLG